MSAIKPFLTRIIKIHNVDLITKKDQIQKRAYKHAENDPRIQNEISQKQRHKRAQCTDEIIMTERHVNSVCLHLI